MTMLPLISKCCSMVGIQTDGWSSCNIDSTLLPCCVPQQFDLACLQDDIAKILHCWKAPSTNA